MKQSALTGWSPVIRERQRRGAFRVGGEIVLAGGWIALLLVLLSGRADAVHRLQPMLQELSVLVGQLVEYVPTIF